MTAFKDFHRDFPKRCLEVLKLAEPQAKLRQREVTLILMVASAGLVMPLERLRSREPDKQHPIGDRERYGVASKRMDELLAEEFQSSTLDKGSDDWTCGNAISISDMPDTWPEMETRKSITQKKTVGGVIKPIRNALAHGNIFTCNDPIKQIVFAQDKNSKGKYPFICVSPEDFKTFIESWFKFLESKDISNEDAKESIERAAA